MLLRLKVENLKLQSPQAKVLKLSPAVGNTFILVVCSSDSPNQKLMHIDSSGKVLWERTYKESLDTFGMFNEREVIVLNVARGEIEIIDLTNYETRTQKHNFTYPDTSHMQIHTFYDTRLLCVQENGLIGDGKLVLTYYLYTSHSFEMQSQYHSQPRQWNYGNPLSKANNHSKVAWWTQNPPQTQQAITFSFWDCSKDPKGSLETVKVRNTLDNILGAHNVSLCVSQLWESKPDNYILGGTSTHLGNKLSSQFYFIDAVSGIIRKSKFQTPSSNYIHLFNLGQYSAIHASDFRGGNSTQQSSVLYIDNQTETLALTGTWKPSFQTHFYLPGYDPNCLIEAIHENSDVSSIEVTTKRLMTVSEMYLYFLLSLNEDFDDDLLQDALDEMDCIQIV